MLDPDMPEDIIDQLEGQFLNYQIDELPKCGRVDVFWHSISTMKDENGQFKCNILAKVMLAILIIFHSNADSECVFSLVTKNKNKFRPNLSTKVLSSIITHKMCLQSSGQKCYSYEISKNTLKTQVIYGC